MLENVLAISLRGLRVEPLHLSQVHLIELAYVVLDLESLCNFVIVQHLSFQIPCLSFPVVDIQFLLHQRVRILFQSYLLLAHCSLWTLHLPTARTHI